MLAENAFAHCIGSTLSGVFLTSMIKAIGFGTIIVHVGCDEGFHVSGGPVGVGRSTTAAVVKSIFLVVVADLLFTAFFYLFW